MRINVTYFEFLLFCKTLKKSKMFLDALASLKTMLVIKWLSGSCFQDFDKDNDKDKDKDKDKVLQSVTECYRVLQSITKYYRVF